MIAACPKCLAKYRVDAARLSPRGARLRCAKCQVVFSVRAPGVSQSGAAAAPEQSWTARSPAGLDPRASERDAGSDRESLIVVAAADRESGKQTRGRLAAWGLQPVLVHDGVEALLTIQRMLPPVAILDAGLPKMDGSQICEIVKRNESLRSMKLVLVGSSKPPDGNRRPPRELYSADVYMEKPELSEHLGSVLSRFGYAISARTPEPGRRPTRPDAVAKPPVVSPAAAATPVQARSHPPAPVDERLLEQRAEAERLARVIVSDILLYHPGQFEAGLASGQLAEALGSPIAEGRGFFAKRVDPRVRDDRDYILEELQRVAQARAGG